MEDEQYNEIIRRLDRIEKMIKDGSGYDQKILSNIIGNMVWEWLYFGTSGTPIHPPKT